jgi:hypothetical protein
MSIFRMQYGNTGQCMALRLRIANELSAQERKLVMAIADIPQPCTPTQAADASRLHVNKVTNILTRLYKKGYMFRAGRRMKPQWYLRKDVRQHLNIMKVPGATVATIVDVEVRDYTPEEVQNAYR